MKKDLFILGAIGLLTLSLCPACSEESANFGSDSGLSGQGGSMARFTIKGDYLYTVDNQTLKVFDLTESQHPKYLYGKDQVLGFGIETISTLDSLLLVGSQDGLYLFDIKRPDFPSLKSKTDHFRSCDPVVASGHYAYVTLNSENTWCGNSPNLLDVYDIANPAEPVLVTSIPLNYPKGLGIDGDKLFVCDKNAGIKVFNISDPEKPEWVDDLSYIPETQNINTYDVIPLNGLLLVSATQGIYQLDYSGEKMKYVSKIGIKGE
jgi:hypothetical protein